MRGLVFGKFYPFHKGHQAMIDFALAHCEQLHVLVCAAGSENIPGEVRREWIRETYCGDCRVLPQLLEYDESLLPNTSESSAAISALWAIKFAELFPDLDVVITSEPYGDLVAESMGIRHLAFDPARERVAVSATAIRQNPHGLWEMLPTAVRPWYVKTVCLAGTESTGKSTLAGYLAAHFDTICVPEAGREIIPVSAACTMELLVQTAEAHASAIQSARKKANKILLVDTDIHITRSYAKFMFGEAPDISGWILDANRMDLHLYSNADAPFIQDGTRLNEAMRKNLDQSHRKTYADAGIKLHELSGRWKSRREQAISLIEKLS